jgi:hypothetical protein
MDTALNSPGMTAMLPVDEVHDFIQVGTFIDEKSYVAAFPAFSLCVTSSESTSSASESEIADSGCSYLDIETTIRQARDLLGTFPNLRDDPNLLCHLKINRLSYDEVEVLANKACACIAKSDGCLWRKNGFVGNKSTRKSIAFELHINHRTYQF